MVLEANRMDLTVSIETTRLYKTVDVPLFTLFSIFNFLTSISLSVFVLHFSVLTRACSHKAFIYLRYNSCPVALSFLFTLFASNSDKSYYEYPDEDEPSSSSSTKSYPLTSDSPEREELEWIQSPRKRVIKIGQSPLKIKGRG